jgi:hypothetical protein
MVEGGFAVIRFTGFINLGVGKNENSCALKTNSMMAMYKSIHKIRVAILLKPQ